MHAQGPSAWFDSGDLERELILSMADFSSMDVLEIGCGEGQLAAMIAQAGARMVDGIDYADIPAKRVIENTRVSLMTADWRDWEGIYDIVVMQGVLEHFDRPFDDLKTIIDRFKPGMVITSSPGFLNPRGIIWHTLDMLGAVMSKTDLHYLNPWQFESFCTESGYKLTNCRSCDNGWGFGQKMVDDLRKRIPLALRDGGIPVDEDAIERLLSWLEAAGSAMPANALSGATICYRIDIL